MFKLAKIVSLMEVYTFLNEKKQDKWQICIDKVTIVRNSCFELIEYDMYHGRWMYPVYSRTKGVH